MSTQPAKTTSAGRTRAYRARLKAQGLRPRTLWTFDIADPAFRAKLRAESLSLRNDAAEQDAVAWLEAIQAEDDPWR